MRNNLLMAAMVALMPCALAQGPDGDIPTTQLPLPPPLVRPPQVRPPKLEHVPKAHAEGLLGQPVIDAKGTVIGHVVDVLIDQTGKPKAAVIEFAGFLGLGDRKIAVSWTALEFSVAKDQISIVVTLDADKLKALPQYQEDDQSVPVAVEKAPKPPTDTNPAP
jgi:sporulation protein YlmC with PRC-barrel domain